MKTIMFFLCVGYYSFGTSQDTCLISAPTHLVSTPDHRSLFFGDTVSWIISSPLTEDSSWYVLYHDFCCGTPLMKTKDTFSFVIHHQGRYYVRNETPCGVSTALGIDIDVHPLDTPDDVPTEISELREPESSCSTIMIHSLLGQLLQKTNPMSFEKDFSKLDHGYYVVTYNYHASTPRTKMFLK